MGSLTTQEEYKRIRAFQTAKRNLISHVGGAPSVKEAHQMVNELEELVTSLRRNLNKLPNVGGFLLSCRVCDTVGE